ncbi:MAG: hypothetical protein ACOX6E_00410 [Syntrophomonadaceae bacterium]
MNLGYPLMIMVCQNFTRGLSCAGQMQGSIHMRSLRESINEKDSPRIRIGMERIQ